MVDSFEPSGGEFDRLTAVENRRDDIGREKAEWEDPADVALIDAKTLGEITDRLHMAVPDLSEPMVPLCDGGDQPRVGVAPGGCLAGALSDQIGLCRGVGAP